MKDPNFEFLNKLEWNTHAEYLPLWDEFKVVTISRRGRDFRKSLLVCKDNFCSTEIGLHTQDFFESKLFFTLSNTLSTSEVDVRKTSYDPSPICRKGFTFLLWIVFKRVAVPKEFFTSELEVLKQKYTGRPI